MNGVTLIRRLDGSWLVIGPTMADRRECLTTAEKDEYLKRLGFPVIFSHIHPGGINGEAK